MQMQMQMQMQRQRPRGLVVEKVRAVWAGGDPRGPSAAPQDDTLSNESGKSKGKGKGKGKGKSKSNGKGHVVWWWKRSGLSGLVQTLGVLRLRLRMTPFLKKVAKAKATASAKANTGILHCVQNDSIGGAGVFGWSVSPQLYRSVHLYGA
jgi:hypothetical protein